MVVAETLLEEPRKGRAQGWAIWARVASPLLTT